MRNRRLKIAFDLDGTLIDLNAVAVPLIETVTGLSVEGCNHWNVAEYLGVDDALVWDCYKQAFHMVDQMPVMSGASELMRKLYEMSGDPITIVSSRPDEFANDAFAACRKVCGDVPFLLGLTSSSEEKYKYLRGFRFFVDDKYETAEDLAGKGMIVFMPNRFYNQEQVRRERIINVLLKEIDIVTIESLNELLSGGLLERFV